MREIIFADYAYESYALCRGLLVLLVDGKRVYGVCCLESGGMAFDDLENDYITHGPWSVDFNETFTLDDPARTPDYGFLPENWFSDEEKAFITELVNRNIPQGCCGGCL